MGKLAGALGGGGSAAAIVATLGWPGAAVIVGLAAAALAVAAWVVADAARSSHVAMLIGAIRDKHD